MIKKIKDWLKNALPKKASSLQTQKFVRNKIKPNNKNSTITYKINDPSTKDLIIEVAPPEKQIPETNINGYVGGGQDIDSVFGQAAQCYVTINNCIKYINKIFKPISRWSSVKILNVYPRAGVDFNAFYNRKALKFFYDVDPVTKTTVFTCNSADIVSHELGHAILDSMRPELYSLQSHEVWAFHEAFSDCVAIINVLLYEKAIERILEETKGDLNKSNISSRLAEEMGTAVFNSLKNKNGFLKDCLRDAFNNFVYVPPETLKDSAPENGLSRECHSFSRVWTGAWYEILIKIYEKHVASGMSGKEALIKARDVIAATFLRATSVAPAHVRFYNSVAKQMIELCDKEYVSIITDVFVKRNILKQEVEALSVQQDSLEEFSYKKIYGHTLYHNQNSKIIILNKDDESNPLMKLKIEIPNDSFYGFDSRGNLVSQSIPDETESINCAKACLEDLNNNNLVGEDDSCTFIIENNRLIRKHFVCRCNINNACDPQAPEYGKGWKAKNNAGCCKKSDWVLNCDCDPPATTPPRKVGCYTSLKTVRNVTYRAGGSGSYKTC